MLLLCIQSIYGVGRKNSSYHPFSGKNTCLGVSGGAPGCTQHSRSNNPHRTMTHLVLHVELPDGSLIKPLPGHGSNGLNASKPKGFSINSRVTECQKTKAWRKLLP